MATISKMVMPQPMNQMPEQQRSQILDQTLIAKASQGGRLETRTATTAVVVMGKPVNHVLHLLISVFTCGFWVPVWLIISAVGGEHRRILSVDPFGQVTDTRGPLETYRKILIGIAAVWLIVWLFGVVGNLLGGGNSNSSFAPIPPTVTSKTFPATAV